MDPNGYVCKRRTVTMVELPQEPHYIGSCPDNWFYYGHKVWMHSNKSVFQSFSVLLHNIWGNQAGPVGGIIVHCMHNHFSVNKLTII